MAEREALLCEYSFVTADLYQHVDAISFDWYRRSVLRPYLVTSVTHLRPSDDLLHATRSHLSDFFPSFKELCSSTQASLVHSEAFWAIAKKNYSDIARCRIKYLTDSLQLERSAEEIEEG
jgi:hypothetical protein